MDWISPDQIAWLPDGSALLFNARVSQTSLNAQLFSLSYPDAEVRRVTNDLNFYSGTSITSDGSALATAQVTLTGNLWLANFGSSTSLSPPRQISSGISRADGISGIIWTPDGKIIYTYYTSGSHSTRQRLARRLERPRHRAPAWLVPAGFPAAETAGTSYSPWAAVRTAAPSGARIWTDPTSCSSAPASLPCIPIARQTANLSSTLMSLAIPRT